MQKIKKIRISNDLCHFWKQNPDAYYLAYKLKYISLTDRDIETILCTRFWQNDKYISYFNKWISVYNYNPKALLLYIDMLKTHEALLINSTFIYALEDYIRMMSAISTKFEKYPKNFLTTHQIAIRNYDRLRKEFSEELFKKRINTKYECEFGDYIFIYPKSTQDIKDEAVQQNNCVASYIDKVIDGNCHIMFLRKKDNIHKSLITIEIVDNKIIQALRRYNMDITEEEKEIVNKWNKKFEK